MNIEDYDLNEEQIRACKAIGRAIRKAQKLGLSIYGKQDMLVAYTKKAEISGHICELHESWNKDNNSPVPRYDIERITDSGADDELCFKKGVF